LGETRSIAKAKCDLTILLLLGALERLLVLERHAVSLAESLRSILANMSNKAARTALAAGKG
jgi:hypothetical protein